MDFQSLPVSLSLSLSLFYSLMAFEGLVMYSRSLHTPVEKQQSSSVFVLSVVAAAAAAADAAK